MLIFFLSMQSVFATNYHQLVLEAAAKQILNVSYEAFDDAHEKMMQAPKFIQGVKLSFLPMEVNYDVVQHNDDGTVTVIEQNSFTATISELPTLMNLYLGARIGIFDKYNLQQGDPVITSSEDSVDIVDGLRANAQDLVIKKKYNTISASFTLVAPDEHEVNAEVTMRYDIETYSRPKLYSAPKGEVKFANNRTPLDGEIRYDWEGPRPSTPPQIPYLTAPLTDNKYQLLGKLPSGDYSVSLTAFCGCNKELSADQVFDPFTNNKHKFEVKMVKAKISGVLRDKETGEPLEGVVLSLKPACDKGDDCMKEVPNVMTGENGFFRFYDVPKGVYNLYYKDQPLKRVSNCDFMSPAVNIGDVFLGDLPVRYEISGSFHGTQAIIQHFDFHVGNVLLRTLTNDDINDPKIVNYGGGDTYSPVDTDGNPLKPPFYFTIGGMFKMLFYGFNTVPMEVSNIETRGFACGLDTSDTLPGFLFTYGDLAGVPMPRPLNYQAELQMDFRCEGIGTVGFHFETGRDELPSLPNLVAGVLDFPDAFKKKLKKCEDFEQIGHNQFGETLEIHYHCLGYDTE